MLIILKFPPISSAPYIVYLLKSRFLITHVRYVRMRLLLFSSRHREQSVSAQWLLTERTRKPHFTVVNKNVFCFVNLNNTHLACVWNISSLLIRRFSIDSPVNLFGHTLEHNDKVAVKSTVWSLKGAIERREETKSKRDIQRDNTISGETSDNGSLKTW